MSASLCSPGPGLSCFACCPPIRPPGYDHLEHRGPLTRLFCENRAGFLAGELPAKQITGYFCPGLGFLDPGGKTVGCLYHPARNQGRDLRGPTGYQPKCSRETCLAFDSFAALGPGDRRALIALCQGLGPFEFSSPAANPVMRLLEFGPRAAALVANLEPGGLAELEALGWLRGLQTSRGWLLGRLGQAHGAGILARPELASELEAGLRPLAARLGRGAPQDQGSPLHTLTGRWEARFWQAFLGRNRAESGALEAWRAQLFSHISGFHP